MENKNGTPSPSLAELKKRLKEAGLSPVDYRHLSYEDLRKLAGEK